MSSSPSRPAYPDAAAARIALPWVVRLRYALAAGQVVTVLVVDRALGIDLPLRWIAVVPVLMAATNVWLARGAAAVSSASTTRLVSAVFVFDTLALTALLMLTGGPSNPFSLLYLVHITLSATILTKRQTWALGALATLCFGALFLLYRPIPMLEMHRHGGAAGNLHLVGMWIGFAMTASLVAMFSGKISELLREREAELLSIQEELAKKDRLASLVTLAAGAAHELSTPLGTIAIVARELEHAAAAGQIGAGSGIAEDSRLIRNEVERCRAILERLSAEGGAEPAGESAELVTVAWLLQEAARHGAADLGQTRVLPSGGASACLLRVPRRAVARALAGLVKNAVEASATAAAANPSGRAPVVELHAETIPAGGAIRLTVTDRGIGMSEDTLRHAGEPFFSTKEPGSGMGLGVFLARTLAERLGGRLTFESEPGKGTIAALELPAASQL